MEKWLTHAVALFVRHGLPLLVGAALMGLAAAGWLESERAQLARCVLLADEPKSCVSLSSASPLTALQPARLFRLS